MLDTEYSQKTRVALKFCGCCNPQVDLGKIARYLAQIAEAREEFQLVPLAQGIDIAVILCGCPRACGNKEEVKAKARQTLVMAGERLDGELLAEEQLPIAVQDKLDRIIKKMNSK